MFVQLIRLDQKFKLLRRSLLSGALGKHGREVDPVAVGKEPSKRRQLRIDEGLGYRDRTERN